MVIVKIPDEVILKRDYPSFLIDNTDKDGKVVITCTDGVRSRILLNVLKDKLCEMNPDLYIRNSSRPELVSGRLRTVVNFKMKKTSKKAAPEEKPAEKTSSKKASKKDPTKKVPSKRAPSKKTPSKKTSTKPVSPRK